MEGNNNTIRPGDVVYVRISGEPVFVLGLYPMADEETQLSGVKAATRRYVISKRTGSYDTTYFAIEELETNETRNHRLEAEVMKIQGLQAMAQPVDPNASFAA